jgi:drug/metabolite transporter (DMT)-like permease
MALGLPASNPFAFALYREIAAGIILLLAAALLTPLPPPTTTTKTTRMMMIVDESVTASSTSKHENIALSASPLSSSGSVSMPATSTSTIRNYVSFLLKPLGTDFQRFCLLGFVMYGNQAGVIAGIKLAGPVAAAVWQPSQPIMTAAISMVAGWEVPNRSRIGGVLLSFVGCTVMVVMSMRSMTAAVEGSTDTITNSTIPPWIQITTHASPTMFSRNKFMVGNFLFFINCLCTSLYVILSKRLLLVHPPLVVTAWTYNLAAIYMSATAVLTSLSSTMMTFFCPDCIGTWTIPPRAIPALVYAVLFNSVIAYGIMTWANRHVTGTLVMIYTVLQPVTAALLTGLLVQVFHLYPDCHTVHTMNTPTSNNDNESYENSTCLDPPGWGTLVGICGVFMGLYLVVATEPKSSAMQTPAGDGGSSRGSRYESVAVTSSLSEDDDGHRRNAVSRQSFSQEMVLT